MENDDLDRLDNIPKDYRHHYHIIGSAGESGSNPSTSRTRPAYLYSSFNDAPKVYTHVKRRGWIDIASAMLKAAKRGELKSKIAAEACLSYPQLNEYIDLLVGNDMLHYSTSARTFHTTEKGEKLLELYHQSRQILYPKR